MEEQALAKPFRLNCKKLWITYPQCSVPKDVLMTNVKEYFGESVDWVVIAMEKHQDGTPHLHAGIALKEKVDLRGASTLDVLAGQHGNYQAMKHPKNCVKYITKDGDWISFGLDVNLFITNGVFGQIEKLLMDGISLQELMNQYPGFVIQHWNKILQFRNVMLRDQIRNKPTTWKGCYAVNPLSHNHQNVVDWLNRNIQKERAHKQSQLWLYSPPNMGKSTLLMMLDQALRVLWVPKEENFLDMWEDMIYDLAVIDEFHGQKKLTWLNEFLEGTPMPIAVKGSQTMKRHNIPIIICSNGSPRDCYAKVSEQWLDPLYARLECYDIVSFLEIKFN